MQTIQSNHAAVSSIKLAIFVPSMEGGGAERVMMALANGISARGYQMDLVLASAQGPYLKSISPKVRIVDLQSQRVSQSLPRLRRYLRTEKPAAMLSAMNHANVIAVLARFTSGVKTRLIVSERTTISIEAAQPHGFTAQTVYRLVPWAYRKADGIVAVSNDVARDLEQFANLENGRVQTIYNPFNLASIGHRAAQPVPHSWLNTNERPVVLAVGRLTAQKDFPTLIKAFSLIYQKHNARLLILGDGELRQTLTDIALSCGLNDDNFQMPGFTDNPFAYLSRSALFVLSSAWEGLPGVLIEALSCSTPVVSTDCPSGPREILENGRWGKLVPVGDVQALANAMSETLSTPKHDLPDVFKRAQDFDESIAVDAYLAALGFPPTPPDVSNVP